MNFEITQKSRFTFGLHFDLTFLSAFEITFFSFERKTRAEIGKSFIFEKKCLFFSCTYSVCVYVISDKLVKLLALLNRQHSWFRFQAPWHSSSKNQTFLVFNLKYSCGLTICVVVKRANFVILGLSQKDANLIKAAIN